jgi:hypothetical protein
VEVLERFQAWHRQHLHAAVSIETTRDQPGWSLRIELGGTPLAGLKVAPYKEGIEPRDWLAYRVKDDVFEGRGDPTKLQALLYAFLDLAGRATSSSRPP